MERLGINVLSCDVGSDFWKLNGGQDGALIEGIKGIEVSECDRDRWNIVLSFIANANIELCGDHAADRHEIHCLNEFYEVKDIL